MGNAAPSVKAVAETSSSCVTQGITAAHNFEVINFSILECMGVGKFVSSRNFHVGGYAWNIRFYPDGQSAEDKHHVSAYLILQGGGQQAVRVRFTFTVLSNDGKEWTKRITELCDSNDSKSRSFRTMLCDSNDSFTVRCVLTVIQDPRVSVVVPEPSVLRDLARMLRDGDGADVTFVVGERPFPVHRYVLAARSAVFRAELFGPMKEKAATRVRIHDMEPSVFEALLHFVYTDSLPDDDKDMNVAMVQHLLVAADRYGLDRLKAICEDKLCHAIDVETAATTLTLAEQHHCVHLKDVCLRFMASRHVLRSVIKTDGDGYKHLVRSCPLLMNEILDNVE